MDNRQQSPSRALKITPILGLAILCLLSLQALLAQSSGDAHVSSFNNAGNSAPSNTASNPVAAPTPPTPNPTPNPTPDPNQIDTDGDGVPDVQDGWPKCNALAPAVLPIPYYVLVEIGEAGTWGTDINNSGHALITNGYAGDAWFWDGSNSIPLQTSGSVLGLLNDNDYYFDSGSGEIYYMSGVMCNLQVPQGFKDDWHVDEWEMLTLHYGETLSGPRYPSYGVSACFISIDGNAYGSVSGFARINWRSWCQLNAFQGCIWNNSGTNDGRKGKFVCEEYGFDSNVSYTSTVKNVPWSIKINNDLLSSNAINPARTAKNHPSIPHFISAKKPAIIATTYINSRPDVQIEPFV